MTATVTEPGSPPASAPMISCKFVTRVSGLPVAVVDAIVDDTLTGLVRQVLALDRTINEHREALSTALFDAIGMVADKRVRSRLLQLRRGLYNARATDATVAAVLPPDVRAAVEAQQSIIAQLDTVLAELSRAYDRALLHTRRRLRLALDDADFQQGLALSSKTLFANLRRYMTASDGTLGSRDEQIERGLLRYFTRMATKSTPFGMFCAVIGGEFDDGCTGGALLAFDGDPRCKRSVVRINKRIYALVWERLCRRRAIRERLVTEINPSLRMDGDRLQFLTAHGGHEVFQRLPRSAVLDIVLEIAARGDDCLPYGELTARLAADERCETSAEEAQAFLDRLIEIGMLRFQAVVPEQEAEWTGPLAAFLQPITEDEHACIARGLLGDLEVLRTRYAAAAATERAGILEAGAEGLAHGLRELDLPATATVQPLLYEDATADARFRIAATANVRRALERFAEWAELTGPLNGFKLDMAPMRHFFDGRYGMAPSAHAVPLLTFYEDYYREHFREHLEKVRSRAPGYDAGNPFALVSVKRLRAAWGAVFEAVRRSWAADPAVAEICVTRAMLEAASAATGAGATSRERSVAAFAQVVETDRGNILIVPHRGQIISGYGKFFSRFLYLLPEAWRAAAFADNARLTCSILAEICGDAAFNANLHPPLLAWEISYPTGQRGRTARHIPTAELVVEPDPEDPDALILVHAPTQWRVHPVDLGFLNPMMRPPLYQLLSRFSVAAFQLPLPESPTPPADGPSAQRVTRRPRITYAGCIVLARESWLVPDGCFPRQPPYEPDAEYFVRLARWRRDHGIPERVYVRVQPRPAMAAAGAAAPERPFSASPAGAPAAETPNAIVHDPNEDREAVGYDPQEEPEAARELVAPLAGQSPAPPARFSRDFFKPQYIDFSSPLLVKLFARIGGALTHFDVRLEECLPAREQLPVGPDGPYAFEMVLQVGFPAAAQRGV